MESKQLTFTPELRKITKLGNMKECQVVKSPSWPSSPTTPRTDMKRNLDDPPFWTLGRRGDKVSDCDFRDDSDRNLTRDDAIHEIQAILSSMNLGKYYVGMQKGTRSNSTPAVHPLRRSVSVQPQVMSNNSLKKSFLDSLPPPPKTKSILESGDEPPKRERIYSLELSPIKHSPRRQQVNSKLKELTERLRPSSAPPSPHGRHKNNVPLSAPPTSSFSFFKDPLPSLDGLELSPRPNNDHEISPDLPPMENLLELNKMKNGRCSRSSSRKSNGSGFATLPRTKAIEISAEPRTLASLDLNINFASLRNHQSSDDQKEHSSSTRGSSLKKKEHAHSESSLVSNENAYKNKARRGSEEEVGSTHSSRRGSLKTSSARKADFDLNFSKYGSLTSNKMERKKSVGRRDSSSSSENIHRPEASSKFNRKTGFNFGSSKSDDTESDSKPLEEESDMQERREVKSDGTKSVPALPSSFTNPLEEEIRTIAKLLDGKESLFLKLIKSSNMDIPQPDTSQQSSFEMPDSPEVSRRPYSQKFSDRNSPNRLRAMTVPGSESNRGGTQPQKSPPPQQKRFYKKRLRGPYGEMLEQEMSKSVNKPRPSYAKDLDFLKELENSNSPPNGGQQRPRTILRSSSHSLDETHSIVVDGTPKRKTSANIPLGGSNEEQDSLLVPPTPVSGTVSEPTLHIRSHSDSVKTSSTWNVDTMIVKTLKQTAQRDTRTHIVGELYETEMSYVESLQIIVKKYMVPLKSNEHSGEIEGSQVDQIFCQVPEILKFHETFLDTLKSRLGYWDTKQKIGDVFISFTRSAVVDTYIEFINNWKDARDAIKAISQAKPGFAKFLEHTSREHKGKLTLDALLIMPVQRIPRYELLIKELLKHTPMDHPDYKLLLQAQKEVHDLAVKINKVEREALQQEQRLQRLREVEQLIEGVVDLTQGERSFVRHDFVMIPGGLGMKKERCLFLFTDMLLITSIKKKGGAIRKTSIAVNAASYGSLESNKYKLLMKTSLHNVDILKVDTDDICARTFLREVANLENDLATLGKISEVLGSLNCDHQYLEDAVKDLYTSLTKQLSDRQASCSQLMSIELAVTINDEIENITVVFPNAEQRMTFEAAFLDTKDKMDNVCEKNMPPEFLCSLPLRKTRAGLQITCAAAVVDSCQSGLPDLWICSSDGYVGQVCVLTFQTEPVIASSVNICNARILCIAAVPGVSSGSLLVRRRSTLLPYLPGFKYEKIGKGDRDAGKGKSFPLDSDSEDDEFIDANDDDPSCDDANTLQPTMWLGTEDGCIYVFNCTDMRLQRPKLRIHHSTCIYDIIHVNEKVFVSLANGELVIYSRDHSGLWNTSNPHKTQIATNVAPISKMVLVEGKLWCSTLNSIAIIDTASLELEYTFQVVSDIMRHITAIVLCEHGVWVSVQSSPVIHLYNATTYSHMMEINISIPVTKMLSAYDEIIKQHKLACLRVSSICVEKNLLWIGTSAGVVLNLIIPSIPSSSADIANSMIGMPHGHFGHVRFLTSIYATSTKDSVSEGLDACGEYEPFKEPSSPYSALVISGGDGYEDFSHTASVDTAGRDDSTNHLLMWRV